jgi:peptidoglycan-associated lipoprotein
MRLCVTALLSLGIAVTAGCAAEQTPPAAPGGPMQQPVTAAPTAVQTAEDSKDPGKATIAVSDEIRAACGVDETDAYFAYDSARINARARQILGKIARCFKDGPLAGKSMRLVGHADPRGDEEYNLLLGGRRADSVKGTLEDSGLSGSRVSTTSRGEMEATGTDEESWAKDRRVDVLLGGSS